MSHMFAWAAAFTGDISKWNVSKVTNMSVMFGAATAFNSDISKWDVSRVKDMSGMFSYASSFNVDISKWDVSSVTNMDQMFKSAASFNQELCGPAWVLSKASKYRMFEGASRQANIVSSQKGKRRSLFGRILIWL